MTTRSVTTISDIARLAGVSKTAASYAFNDPSRLGKETVERILAVAEELGYSPNPVARSMSIGRTGTIGVLVPQPLPEVLQNPFFAEFLEGVAEAAGKADLPIMLVPPIRGSMQHAVNGAAVDGFLTLGLEAFRPAMHILERRGRPYVMVDSDPAEGVACVNVDDEGGAYAAMRHVLNHGHRDIAILGIRSPQRGQWQKYAGTLKRRMTGYLRALAEADLTIDANRVRLTECEVSEEGGRAAFNRLWKRGHRPTALVAMGDLIAVGALEAALQAGVAIPDDLSIIGFDDIPEARWVSPALTTVRQPARDKGRVATELLIELLAGATEPWHVKLETQLIERQSVAPVRA
jgi:DNA-binding LacI/PurR family transcriptional regulator